MDSPTTTGCREGPDTWQSVRDGFVRLRLRGQIQGVGFRPFVYRLAAELGLVGTVRNDPGGVTVDAWGPAWLLEELERRLPADAPPLASVEAVERAADAIPPAPRPDRFRIVPSEGAATSERARGRVTVDAAVCDACLAELRDPADRRHRHGLINCTGCGPRYTIVRDLPYDRPLTTMAGFPLCPECGQEYEDPADRRFHAQPVCCPRCGPRVVLCDPAGGLLPGDPYREMARILAGGGIVAMKGLGGFHLVVDATDPAAVARLRQRKARDHKPFALMVRDLEEARRLVRLSAGGEELLASSASPIVVAERVDPSGLPGTVAQGVAPGQHRLGVLLPSTPMQHLLADVLSGPVVMTSANRSDDPLVKDDEELATRLAGVADAWLTHDRPIERAVDDSVFLDTEPSPLPVRRARGLVPAPLTLPLPGPGPGFCAGADLKNAVAVVRGADVVLSQHLGDLTHPRAHRRFTRTLADLERLFGVDPGWAAVDLHPRYLSRRHGLGLARERGLEVVEVQHHHAHLASLLAEHGRTGPAVGVVCDGVGYGLDGTAWGGEILVGDLQAIRRAGHLRPLRLPGGDVAARRTGRCALSWMVDALGLQAAGSHPLAGRALADDDERRAVLAMLRGDLASPPSTGAGRLFDAAASLLGICDHNHHEAMAGQLLESAASRAGHHPSGDGCLLLLEGDTSFQLDTRPLLHRLLDGIDGGTPPEELAWLVHDALAHALAAGALRAAEAAGVATVGLTGGVFCNLLLTDRVRRRLRAAGVEVLLHRAVPPNDGGIAYGQAAVAAARLTAGER